MKKLIVDHLLKKALLLVLPQSSIYVNSDDKIFVRQLRNHMIIIKGCDVDTANQISNTIQTKLNPTGR